MVGLWFNALINKKGKCERLIAYTIHIDLALSIRAVTPVTDMFDGPLSTFRLDSLVLEFRRITSRQDAGLL